MEKPRPNVRRYVRPVRQSRERGWLGDVGHVRVVSVLSTAIWKVLVCTFRRRKSW
jgi:hypothetical protein